MTRVQAIKCKKCQTVIFSRAVHDFHYCPCKTVAIDGGFDYTRILGNAEDFIEMSISVEQTPKELYDDWNNNTDKYGTIKESKTVKKKIKKIKKSV